MSIPHELRQLFPGAIKTLECMQRYLKGKETGGTNDSAQLLWGEGSENVTKELRLLREALNGVNFDPSLFKEEAPTVVDEILQDVEAMFASFAYYYKSGDQHSIMAQLIYCLPGCPVR